MKLRIRQLYPHHSAVQPEENVPRGWINPQGRFFATKEHWVSINSHFRRPDTRAVGKEEAPEEAEAAERNAQLAYSLGWISVGHAGKLNAVGHQRTFQMIRHPAVMTLRQLLVELPNLTIQVETQFGDYLPSRGTHEDFQLGDYDLDFLIKRGKLRRVQAE